MTTDFSTIAVKIDSPIVIITLNRPDQRNALNDVMIRELTEALNAVNRASDIRGVILTGAKGAFCSGMDLEYLKASMTKTHEENLEDARNLHRLLKTLHQLKKVSIAAVNGPAMGGGCGLAAACDYVFLAREKGRMGVPETRLGFVPAIILHYLIKRMGSSRTREFVLQGGLATPSEAVAKGLATEVHIDTLLLDECASFARRIASQTSPSSIALTKELFNRFDEMETEQTLEYADQLNALTRKTEDFKKGIESVIKKEDLTW